MRFRHCFDCGLESRSSFFVNMKFNGKLTFVLARCVVQGNCGSTSNKLQQNLFYRAIDKVDELNNILKVPKNPIGGTC